MSPRRLVELTTSERRRVVSGAIARFVATFAGVIAIYYLLPLSQGVAGPDDVIRILVAAAVFVAIVFWQVRQIMRADLPALRALEAVGFVIPLFLCSYAAIYVLLSLGSPDNFSEPLTRSAALYFAIVVFGTVGFGDIFPSTDLARLVVSSQILGGLIFIAAVVRVFLAATKFTLEHKSRSEDSDDSPDD